MGIPNANTDKKISIHAPREGGDLLPKGSAVWFASFQSTPPARGATREKTATALYKLISIHAPREGGDGGDTYVSCNAMISIHAPREGGDTTRYWL